MTFSNIYVSSVNILAKNVECSSASNDLNDSFLLGPRIKSLEVLLATFGRFIGAFPTLDTLYYVETAFYPSSSARASSRCGE